MRCTEEIHGRDISAVRHDNAALSGKRTTFNEGFDGFPVRGVTPIGFFQFFGGARR